MGTKIEKVPEEIIVKDEAKPVPEMSAEDAVVSEALEKLDAREVAEGYKIGERKESKKNLNASSPSPQKNVATTLSPEKNQKEEVEEEKENNVEMKKKEKEHISSTVEQQQEDITRASFVIDTEMRNSNGLEDNFRDKETIIIPTSNPEAPSIKVEVELINHPFLGGCKNTETGVKYHHAQVQTQASPKKMTKKFTRATQTQIKTTKSQQTKRECGTQMSKNDLLIDTSKDYVLRQGNYRDSEKLNQLKKQKIIIMQCAVRQWLARKEARRMMEERNIERERIVRQLNEMEQAKIRTINKIEKQKNNPQTIKDFRKLQKEVENWRILQTKNILNQNLSEEDQIAALSGLVHEEVEKLKEIENKKVKALNNCKKKRKFAQLNKMCETKKWITKDGKQ